LQGVLAGSPAEVRFIAEASPIGTPVVLIAADGRRYESVLRKSTTVLYDAITFADGLVFWTVAALVFAPRASPGAPRGFFWATLLYGLAIMLGGVHFPGPPTWSSVALGIAWMACLSILPAIFFHVTLSFPRRHRVVDRKPIAAALAIVAAGLTIAQGLAYVGYVRAPSPATWRVFDTARRSVDAILVSLVAAGTVMLFAASRRLVLSREREQTKWLMWGIAVGVTPYVFLRTLPRLFGFVSPLDPAVDRLFELAVPLAFLGAVVRHQFLDIDIIIRRSLIYGLLAASMLAVYVTLGIGIGGRLDRGPDHRWLLIPTALGLGAGMMFSPLRRVIGRWVDRTLFKIDYEYERATALLRPELENAAGQEALADLVSTCLRSHLRPITCAVVIRDRHRTIVVGNAAHEAVREMMNSWRQHDPGAPSGNGTLAALNSTSLPEIESADFPSEFAMNEFVLMEAFVRGGAVTGLILLGRRETQRRYVDADIALVRSVAAEAARAMERIHLVQVAQEESAARRHSEEMNRMRSDFLSRVAHDLRTPLTSISWSAANLQDGVAGPLTDRQVEYLRSIRASSGHLNRLVNNLLDLSRLENAEAVSPGTRPVHMSDLLEDAMTALQPLAQEKGVRFRLEVAAGTRAIVGNADRLLEVALNLLDNALKYTAPNTIIEVSLPAAADECQAFTVRDRGPGFGDDNPAPLFERFRQGPSSPHSPQLGFGLGLYIVRSYLDLMGGRVAAQNHPEGGALLMCILPAAEQRERERVTDR
jgi:signal transduction histidine kinase